MFFLDQTYVMAADGKQTVKAYLAEVSKEVGATVALKSIRKIRNW